MSTPSEPTLPPHSEAFLAEINAQLKQQLDAATKELEYARLKIQVLEERLRLRRIEKYGPSSEKPSACEMRFSRNDFPGPCGPIRRRGSAVTRAARITGSIEDIPITPRLSRKL